MYFHNDHLGSTSVTTNQAGSIAETTTYDPWGEITSGGTQNKFLYTGQEKDSETGLNYYNARYYDSKIRRFTQPDDIIQDVYDPQTLNRYSYVRNNPLRYTDPTGHYAQLLYYGAMYATMVSSSPDLQSDMQFLAMDTADFQQNPSVGKGLALGVSALSVAAPGVPNSGASRVVSKHADNAIKNSSHLIKKIPNPFGKKGGPAHQAGVKQATIDLKNQGYTSVSNEFKVNTQGGIKQSRFGDVYGISPQGKETIVQVGRQTKAGQPVSRERQAIQDILNRGKNYGVEFRPYNK